MAARILSIFYDQSLLQTRQWLLEGEGYLVTSAMRLKEAVELCRDRSFDLVIIGYSIPDEDRQRFITALRFACSTPVLALLRFNENVVERADYNFDASCGPAELVRMVMKILLEVAAA